MSKNIIKFTSIMYNPQKTRKKLSKKECDKQDENILATNKELLEQVMNREDYEQIKTEQCGIGVILQFPKVTNDAEFVSVEKMKKEVKSILVEVLHERIRQTV